jgi:hypothetical protein
VLYLHQKKKKKKREAYRNTEYPWTRMTDQLPALEPNYARAIELIDEAHSLDPKIIPSAAEESGTVPYELHYARKMTRWLAVRCPTAAPGLQVACRAQHFKRCV